MGRLVNYVLGAGFLAMSGYGFISYGMDKESTPESELINANSSYLREYKGDNPRKAFEYTRSTIEIVNAGDTFGKEKIGELEKNISEVDKIITPETPNSIYSPLFGRLAENMNNSMELKPERNTNDLVFGILCGLVGLFRLRRGIFGKDD